MWVVGQNFTLLPPNNQVTSAFTDFKLGAPVTPQELQVGLSYAAGTWVYTPQVGSGPDPVADPYYNYVDVRVGVVNKYAYVNQTFTYNPDGQSVSVYFDDLVEQSVVKEVVVSNGDKGLPVSKYKPRFPAGTYLEYREDSSARPSYFIAAQYFTPTSTSAQDLANQGLIFPLYVDEAQYTSLVSQINAKTVKTPTRMFRFFKGDRTFFRQGSKVISYTATTNVHPLFAFYVYLQNGVFVETAQYLPSQFEALDYVPYFNPAYVEFSEDTIIAQDGRNLYRVMRAFTPSATVVNWTNTTVANTARFEEYQGNLLRYVDQYIC